MYSPLHLSNLFRLFFRLLGTQMRPIHIYQIPTSLVQLRIQLFILFIYRSHSMVQYHIQTILLHTMGLLPRIIFFLLFSHHFVNNSEVHF